MQRHLHRTLLSCATLIALTALYGCKSAPESTADAAAEVDVIQESATLDRIQVSCTRLRRDEAQRNATASAAHKSLAYPVSAPPPAPLAHTAIASDA